MGQIGYNVLFAREQAGARYLRISQVDLLTLGDRCAQETERFFQGQDYDPRYGFELFRRAILERESQAWELLCDQYQALVAKWVIRHPAFPASDEETAYFVNGAFAKMWTTLTPGKFSHFPNLKSLLGYLKMCVHSIITDYVRKFQKYSVEYQVEGFEEMIGEGEVAVEDQILELAYREALWRSLNMRLRNRKEQQVLYSSFILALKPREIQAQFPETFHTVREVSRTKEKVIARLRRDIAFKKQFI